MFSKKVTWLAFFILVIGFGSVASALSGPQIFFTDLQSGPNSGGENGNGAYVTIYGNGFGATQGASSVSLNGSTSALEVVSWGTPWLWYQKIVVQLLPGAASGNFVVSVGAQSSSAAPFTVRSGNIRYVATSGSDSNAGTFASPWRTIAKAAHSVAAGDIAYIGNGVTQNTEDNYAACISIQDGGTASAPKALIGYPGATATIGGSGSTCRGYSLRVPAISGTFNYWVIANLTFSYWDFDLNPVVGWRVIGNNFSNPKGGGQSATFHTAGSTSTPLNLTFNGNYVHDVGTTAGSIDKYYHAVYFTTNSNGIWMGWNEIYPNTTHSTTSGGCRAVQFYSTSGSDQFDLHVHDNRIHDSICDGVNFSTVNANNGTVEAYNNVIYHVGTGPDPANGSSNYACITVGSSSNPTQPVDIYNNTMYDCGSRRTSDAGALSVSVPARLRNNIIQSVSGETYLTNSTSCSSFSGSNNIWFGGSGTPCSSQLTGNVNSNPAFVNAATGDLSLQSTSPVIDKGTAISTLNTDIDGNGRPQGSGYDIGAYEYGSGSTPPGNQLSPPTNLTIIQ